jgi:ligand-binding sensor domain-containing protein
VTAVTDSVAYVSSTQFSGERIWDIEEVDGYLWIGASSGAFRLTPSENKLQRFQDDESVLFANVYDIERWQDYLWFVSDAGLVKLNLTTAESQSYHDIVTRIQTRALAVNDTIAAVASDKGMTILFHANRSPYTRDFTIDDGLASNNVFSLIMDGDFLWVGTDKGLTRFLWNNPDRVD